MIGIIDNPAKLKRCVAFEAAQKAAHEVVRKAGLVRSHCESCGLIGAEVRLHHDTYDRPLDVRGLCRRCHDSRHRALGWGFSRGPDGWEIDGPHWTPPEGTPSLADCGFRDTAMSFDLDDLEAAGAEAARDRVAKDEERKGARRRRALAKRAGKAVEAKPPVAPLVLAPARLSVFVKGNGMFKKATKEKLKARFAITGPAKAGKTRTALSIAKHLGKRIAVIDTERGSARKYANEPFAPREFDTAEITAFAPDDYMKAMRAAAGEYDVLVIDSLSHAWVGEGGLLDQRDKKGGNSFDAWRTLTPQHNKLVDALLAWPGHIICTMRVKTEYEVTKDSNGKTKVEKLGLAPVQRDGIEYEFDVLARMDHDHTLHITDSRCTALDGQAIRKPIGEEIARELLAWLDDGVEAPPKVEAPKASPYEKMKVADVPDSTSLRAWCDYHGPRIQAGLKAENKGAADLVDRVVARAEALSVPENVVRSWLGFEMKLDAA